MSGSESGETLVVRVTVSSKVERALFQALAKAPADRYATMFEFVQALGSAPMSEPELIVTRSMQPPVRSIAVLPFANLSGDPENEYFGDGLAEELLSLLGSVKGLRVASRTSAFVFKNSKTDLRTIGQTLNVQNVLEGSVRKAGNRIRVTAQLSNATDGYDIWSERYDRELKDVFAIQDEIAHTIVDALHIQITGEQAERLGKRTTVDPEAYDCYLKGRHHWNNRPTGISKAVEYFKQAVAKDPSYALAYTGLADCYGSMGGWEGNAMPPRDAWPLAAAAARRALELDHTLGEAHTSLAHVHLHYDWDWSAAEGEFRQAVELHPAYSTAHHWLSHLAMAMGRPETSLAESRRCLELDPVDLVINVHLIWHYWLARQPDEAIEQGSKTRELHPNSFWSEFFIGLVYEDKQMPDAAVTHLAKAATMSGGSTFVLAALGHAHAAAGQRGKALELLETLNGLSRERYVPAYDRAMIYLGLNQIDPAIEWLQRAYQERSSWISYLNVEPRLAPLRSDPRFIELTKGLGYPEPASNFSSASASDLGAARTP